jgi:hypothetical protein
MFPALCGAPRAPHRTLTGTRLAQAVVVGLVLDARFHYDGTGHSGGRGPSAKSFAIDDQALLPTDGLDDGSTGGENVEVVH